MLYTGTYGNAQLYGAKSSGLWAVHRWRCHDEEKLVLVESYSLPAGLLVAMATRLPPTQSQLSRPGGGLRTHQPGHLGIT